MKRIFILSLLLLASATISAQNNVSEKAMSTDSIFHYASLVNDYFMRITPDPTTDSYVGGKKRNSRIWTRGVYYEGLMAMYRNTPVESWYEYTQKWGDFHKWISNDTSAPTNADYHCCGMAYLDMYMLDPTQEVRKTHIKEHIDKLMYERKSINDWYWIDAIHMAMPIYAQLGVLENDERYFEYMYNMYMYTRDKHGDAGMSSTGKGKGAPLFNESDGFWYRDYQFDPPYVDKTETDKPCYWSRGNGWVYTALMRVLQYGPDTLCHKEQYMADFRAMSEALIACQREDGFWSVSLAAPSNLGPTGSEGPETSGTAQFVAGLAYGVRTGLLDSATYAPHAHRGWNALCHQAVNDDGLLGYVQGTGSAPEHGQAITRTNEPDFKDFGVGCYLLAAAEMYQLCDTSQSTPDLWLGDCTATIDTVALTGEHTGKYLLNISATPENATIYYTLDGTTPSTLNGIRYTAPDTLIKSCAVKAIATAPRYRSSEIATLEFVNNNVVTLSAPIITTSQNTKSVTITLAAAESDAAFTGLCIYYTTNGSEPTLESAVYSEPIEFYGESCTVKAIATGELYNQSAIAEQTVSNAHYMVRGKVIYSTNFHDPLSEWFYPVTFVYEDDKISGATLTGTLPSGITSSNITSTDGFRIHISPKNGAPGIKQYNGWSFTTEKKGRRIILDHNLPYLWILNDASNATVTKDEAFVGPFDVELQLTDKTAGNIQILVGDTFDGDTWEVIAEGSTAEGVLRGSYNETKAKYVRFVTDAKEVYIDLFTIYGEGLAELVLESISPAGGATKSESTVLEPTTEKIELVFNNELAADQSGAEFYFGAIAKPTHNCTYIIEGNKLVVTRPDAATALAAGNYVLSVSGVKDLAGQTIDAIRQFYLVEGNVTALNQIEGQKEVVRIEYISISGVVSRAPSSGLNFRRTIYADGSVEVKKMSVK